MTLTDLRAVHELTPGDMNEPISLDSVENLVTLTATITDKDLDTDSATIDLGAKITFYDDGPTLAVTAPAAINGLDFGSFVLNNNAWGTGSGVATGTNGGWTINDANAGHQPGDQIGNTGGGAVQLERVGDGYEGMHSSTDGFMVDLDASPRDLKISQTVTGLVDGQTYDLRFEAGAPFPNSAHLEVWFGGAKVGDISPTGQMQEYMITLTGGSGPDHNNLLEFRETGTPDNQGTYLANVSVGTIVIDETPDIQADFERGCCRTPCSMRSIIRASIPTCRRNLQRERPRSSLWQPISEPTVRRQAGGSLIRCSRRMIRIPA